MAVGKGSILRASNAGITQELIKESEAGEDGHLNSAGAVVKVPVKCLETMDKRETADPEIISILEESIQKHGMLEPVLVWNKGEENFTVLDGDKRVQAAKNLGLNLIPVLAAEVKEEKHAWEIYQELHRYSSVSNAVKGYQVVSSIRSNVPVYLL